MNVIWLWFHSVCSNAHFVFFLLVGYYSTYFCYCSALLFVLITLLIINLLVSTVIQPWMYYLLIIIGTVAVSRGFSQFFHKSKTAVAPSNIFYYSLKLGSFKPSKFLYTAYHRNSLLFCSRPSPC